jgi:hypothetical protein
LFDRDEYFLNFLQNIKRKSSYYRVAVKDDERRREK